MKGRVTLGEEIRQQMLEHMNWRMGKSYFSSFRHSRKRSFSYVLRVTSDIHAKQKMATKQEHHLLHKIARNRKNLGYWVEVRSQGWRLLWRSMCMQLSKE